MTEFVDFIGRGGWMLAYARTGPRVIVRGLAGSNFLQECDYLVQEFRRRGVKYCWCHSPEHLATKIVEALVEAGAMARIEHKEDCGEYGDLRFIDVDFSPE